MRPLFKRIWWPALLVVVGSFAWLVAWNVDRPRGVIDTMDYTSQALIYRGVDRVTADRTALRFTIQYARPGSFPASLSEYDHSFAIGGYEVPKYRGIFEERPLYPAVGALFMTVFGINGMIVATALAGVIFAVALGLAIEMATGSRVLSLLGIGVAYALPLGLWLVTLHADGWMLAMSTASLAAAMAYLRNPRRLWLTVFAVFCILLVAAKSTNAMALVVTLGSVAALALALRRPSWVLLVGLTAIAVGTLLGFMVLTTALGLPSFADGTLDLLTRHYTQPPPANPIRALAHLSLQRMPHVIRSAQPVLWLILAAAALPLVLIRRAWAGLWIMGAVASMLLFAAHPEPSEGPRYLAPVWISVVVGLSLWPRTLQRLGFTLREPVRRARQPA